MSMIVAQQYACQCDVLPYWGINCGSGFAMVMIKNKLSNVFMLNHHIAIIKITHLDFSLLNFGLKNG
jgi:hypothetical protein